MIVLLVCDVLGERNNGTTIAAFNLKESLEAKGHEVRVLCGDEYRIGQPGFYIVKNLNLGNFLNKYVAKNGVALAKNDKDVIEKAMDGVDIIHCMMAFTLGHHATLMARETGIPVSAGFHCQAENFTAHVFMMNSHFVNWLTYRFFYKRMYKYCDCIHYPSQFICDLFEKIVGPTNHYVISNGVDVQFKKIDVKKEDDGLFRILFIGRYSKEKKHKTLIKAVSLSKHKDKIQLLFAGSGPLNDKLHKYAKKKLPIQPIFKFYSRDELVDVINKCDLYCHPSIIEIEAVSCLEAISCGLVPVICNSPRCATKAFALTDKNLYKCNNAKDLARKIDYWFEHPKEKEELSKKYCGYASEFEFHKCMDKMEAMLKETIEKKKNEKEKA
ncbi:MAG: glycosyltransferase [Bacilli bacterium]